MFKHKIYKIFKTIVNLLLLLSLNYMSWPIYKPH